MMNGINEMDGNCFLSFSAMESLVLITLLRIYNGTKGPFFVRDDVSTSSTQSWPRKERLKTLMLRVRTLEKGQYCSAKPSP